MEIENGILRKVKFFGCCDGDSKAFEILLKDIEIDNIINNLYHIECREKELLV
ncbi:TSCPD domain-containing protein [Fusobacterium sp.]|uniref:TSCPD domain-containing protein n=1 Tax=Fusobacterium sp. TaxID=68766 RepID=UPI00290227F9|nr:TSCPD domain-containing protein [Fusobacterium sp.]MDU1911455.1 TSCPD domain-containing protein [Fusobacterium sp.]